jgi:hypothetical protein
MPSCFHQPSPQQPDRCHRCGNLPARAAALSAAIAADNVATIVSEGVNTLNEITNVLTAIDTLATSLPGALAGAVSPAVATAFAGQFADRLFSYTVVRFLEDRQPVLLGVLGLAGIVDRMTVPNDGGAGTHLSRRLRSIVSAQSSAIPETRCEPSTAGAILPSTAATSCDASPISPGASAFP